MTVIGSVKPGPGTEVSAESLGDVFGAHRVGGGFACWMSLYIG